MAPAQRYEMTDSPPNGALGHSGEGLRFLRGEMLDDDDLVRHRNFGIMILHTGEHDLRRPLAFATQELGCVTQEHGGARCDQYFDRVAC